jgi:hypothetical protein
MGSGGSRWPHLVLYVMSLFHCLFFSDSRSTWEGKRYSTMLGIAVPPGKGNDTLRCYTSSERRKGQWGTKVVARIVKRPGIERKYTDP